MTTGIGLYGSALNAWGEPEVLTLGLGARSADAPARAPNSTAAIEVSTTALAMVTAAVAERLTPAMPAMPITAPSTPMIADPISEEISGMAGSRNGTHALQAAIGGMERLTSTEVATPSCST